MKKRGLVLFFSVIVIVTLLSLSLVSASWFSDFLNKVTGMATGSNKVCIDTDGDDQYVQGDVSYKFGKIVLKYTDKCINSKNLREYYCDVKNNAKSKVYRCKEGCRNGACVSNVTCTDSDGGKNYYVKGTTVGLAAEGVMTTRIDSCWEPNHYGDGYDYVAEYFCWTNSNDGKIYAINTNEKCPNGCQDGACVNKTTVDGCNLINETIKAKIREMQDSGKTIVLKEGQKVYKVLWNYVVIPGHILEVKRIYNASTALDSEVTLRDVFSGKDYKATISADGQATLDVAGRTYTVTYVDNRAVADDEYIILDFPQTFGEIKMTFYCPTVYQNGTSEGKEKYTVELISASDTAATIKVTDANGNSDTKSINEGTSKVVNGVEVLVKNADESNFGFSADIDISGMSLKLP